VAINVDANCGAIYIPNIFSPNGDGINDAFCMSGRCIQSITLLIYDRWGEKVAEIYNDCWDGSYRGKEAAPGVFVYRLEAVLFDGSVIERQGNVTLVR
jgi:gliding motility-associated-like protein